METKNQTSQIFETLDQLPLTRLHLWVVALCAAGFSFDLLEIALGSVLSAVFSTAPHLAPPAQLSWLLASVYVGAVVGAPAFGWFADQYGRRFALTWLMCLLAFASVGAAVSTGVTALTGWRCISGLALGAFPPLMITYLTDLMPAGRRGPVLMITIALATLGPVAGIFTVRALAADAPLGLEGWRWGILVGGFGAAVIAALLPTAPESPRWLAVRGRISNAELELRRLTTSVAVLKPVALPPPIVEVHAVAQSVRKRWAFITTLYFLSPWTTVAFPLLSGAVLAQKGFQLSDTLLYVGVANFGPLLGNLLMATGIDKLSRRTAMSTFAIALLCAGTVFIASDSPGWLMASSLAFNVFVSLQLSAMNIYGGEQFPTDVRGRALAAAWATNRVGAALAPLLLLPLLRTHGPVVMYGVIVLALIAFLITLTQAPRGGARERMV